MNRSISLRKRLPEVPPGRYLDRDDEGDGPDFSAAGEPATYDSALPYSIGPPPWPTAETSNFGRYCR